MVDDEYKRLTTAEPRYKNSIQSRLIIFAVETAMRRGELSRMCWCDFNKRDQMLHIPKAKHGPRTIPLSHKAMEVLESLAVRIDGQVWGMEKKSITRAFKRLTTRLSIDGLRFHDLRHEGTSRLFEKELTIPEVQLITGHGDWRSLQLYTKLKPTDVGKKLNRTVGVDKSSDVAKIR